MADAPENTPAAALGAVIDDLAPRREAEGWAVGELEAGRGFDEVEAELRGAGWAAADAAEVVEAARRETRVSRGVVTRADVVYEVNRRYRRAMGPGWFVGMPTWAAAMRLLYSLGTLVSLRRGGGRERGGGGKP